MKPFFLKRWFLAFMRLLGFYPGVKKLDKYLTAHQIAARKKRGELS